MEGQPVVESPSASPTACLTLIGVTDGTPIGIADGVSNARLQVRRVLLRTRLTLGLSNGA